VTLTVGINDGGNSGSGGAQTDSDTVTLQVAAVNDAPVVTTPISINVNEDVVTALTGISFADVDAGSGTVTATFSVLSGTLTGTTGSGVTVTGSLTLSGSIADINSFIAASHLSFQIALNSTSDALTVGVDDNGNTPDTRLQRRGQPADHHE
jgi:predicted ATP-dependent Lon-type protease